jgi:hypothetical protein
MVGKRHLEEGVESRRHARDDGRWTAAILEDAVRRWTATLLSLLFFAPAIAVAEGPRAPGRTGAHVYEPERRLGKGIPLVAPRRRDVSLHLLSTKKYPDGVVALRYQVAARARPRTPEAPR